MKEQPIIILNVGSITQSNLSFGLVIILDLYLFKETVLKILALNFLKT